MLDLALISNTSYPILIQAAYKAVKILSYREGSATMMSALRSDFNDQSSHTTLDILDQIQEIEHKPIAEIDVNRIKTYIGDIYSFVQSRARDQWDSDDEERGEAVLDMLRNQPKFGL